MQGGLRRVDSCQPSRLVIFTVADRLEPQTTLTFVADCEGETLAVDECTGNLYSGTVELTVNWGDTGDADNITPPSDPGGFGREFEDRIVAMNGTGTLNEASDHPDPQLDAEASSMASCPGFASDPRPGRGHVPRKRCRRTSSGTTWRMRESPPLVKRERLGSPPPLRAPPGCLPAQGCLESVAAASPAGCPPDSLAAFLRSKVLFSGRNCLSRQGVDG